MRLKIYTLTWLLLPFLVTFSACEDVETPTEKPVADTVNDVDKEYKYLALGDSYTIGQGVEEEERWPVQLKARMEEDGFDVAECKIIAQTGWTTTNLLNAIEQAELDDYDMVSLLIGVNNQYQGINFNVFTTEFDSLLNIAADLAGGMDHVFVVSIPDYGVTPFGFSNSTQIGLEIDNYNFYMSEKCAQEGVVFIDITEISRILGASTGALAPDNLHPSGSQYEEWVDEIYPAIEGIWVE